MIVILILLLIVIPLSSEASSREYDSYFKSKETECIKEYAKKGLKPDWVDSCYANKIRKINSSTEHEEITKGILNFHGEYLLDRLWEKKQQKLLKIKQIQAIKKKTVVKPKVIREKKRITIQPETLKIEKSLKKRDKQKKVNKEISNSTHQQQVDKKVKIEIKKDQIKPKTDSKQSLTLDKSDSIKIKPKKTEPVEQKINVLEKNIVSTAKPNENKPKEVKPIVKAVALPIGLAQGATKGFFLPTRIFVGFN